MSIRTHDPIEDWRDIADILNIQGVNFFYWYANQVFVSFRYPADPVYVAAECLIVLSNCFEVPPTEVAKSVGVACMYATPTVSIIDDAQFVAYLSYAPAPVATEQVVPRGYAPAYYLVR